MIRGKLIIIAILSLVGFGACQDNEKREVEINERVEVDRLEEAREAELTAAQQRLDMESNSITARIENNKELSTFSQEMTDARISDNFREDEGPYTVFAPSDMAYNNLSPEERNEMMNTQDQDWSSATLSYLVAEGRMTRDQLRQQIESANGNYTLNTMQGEEITATLDGDDIVLKDAAGNEARIIETDTEASNGIIHVINDVLRPQDPTQNEAAETYILNQTNRNNNNMNTTGNNDTQNEQDYNR